MEGEMGLVEYLTDQYRRSNVSDVVNNNPNSPLDELGRKIMAATGSTEDLTPALARFAEIQQQQAGRQRLAEMMQQEPNLDMTNPQTVARLTALGVPSSVVSDMLQAQGNAVQAGGGATGALIQQLMKATGMTFPQALQAIQTGYRQNTALTPEGAVQPLAGATSTINALKQAETAGSALGAETGREQATLENAVAKLPEIEKTVQELSELGKKATYTMAGNVLDTARKELGLTPREAAVSKSEYIAKVDNQILPLLRDTFGAQFTEKEGETLRKTLGDTSKTPEEKDAVLRAFITQKYRNIESGQRRVGGVPSVSMEELTAPQLKGNTAPPSMNTGSEGIKITEPSTGQWGIRRVK